MNITVFDIICAIIFIIAIIRGLSKGLVREVITLIGCFVSLWIALAYAQTLSQFLIDKLNLGKEYSLFIAFVIILITAILIFRLLASLATKLTESLALGLPNKLLGAFFACCKTALILSILINIFTLFDSNEKAISASYKNQTYSFRPLEKIAPKTMELIGIDTDFATKQSQKR
ncbi:MAG: CvpA family protein [Mangrovibacterium sp.]